MANSTNFFGTCPPPFLQESLFPSFGGYTAGRFCAVIPDVADGQSCCLPCPAADWLYPNNFYDLTRIAGYINVVGLGICIFMLVSFVFLPIEATRRHYLNVCFVFAIIIMQLGFIIPWAKKPEKCHNQITPNNEQSDLLCAFGGALIVFGGVGINMWILIRALFMHLQICWNIEPGKIFFWAAQVICWAVTILLLSTEMSISGVSYRFGDYCHCNQHDSRASIWGPLLGLAGLSLLLQLSTFAYCLHVYIKHSMSILSPATSGSYAESSITNFRGANARAVFRRVSKVVALQWRGLAIAIIVVTDVIFFSLVYTVLDKQTIDATKDPRWMVPWLECVVVTQDKNQCLDLAKPLAVNENLLIAVLIMLAVVGIEAFILICRWQMITGWFKLFQRKFRNSREMQEFASLDAHRYSTNKRQIELLNMPSTNASTAGRGSPGFSPSLASPTKFVTPLTRIENTDYREEYLQQDHMQRAYHSANTSFSRPLHTTSSRYSNVTTLSDSPSTYSGYSKSDFTRQPTLPKIYDRG